MKTPLFIETGIPHWLQPPKRDAAPPFTEYTWNEILEWCRSGKTLTSYCRDNHSSPEIGQLRYWIYSDPQRKAEYLEARKIGAERVEDEMLDIADGVTDSGLPNDVQRDALKISTRKWLLGIWNRDRYGEKRQIDVNSTVDISEAMKEANARIERTRAPLLIEGEYSSDG